MTLFTTANFPVYESQEQSDKHKLSYENIVSNLAFEPRIISYITIHCCNLNLFHRPINYLLVLMLLFK